MKQLLTWVLTGFLLLSPKVTVGQDTLTLMQAVSVALQNNYGISMALNSASIARINNNTAIAVLLPVIQATGSTSRNVNDTRQEFFNGTIREGENAVSKNLNSGVQLTWTVFDGLGMFITRQKLSELARVEEHQLRSTVENTLADVITTYSGIVQQTKLTEVYHQALAISSERERIAKARLQIGSGSELTWLQSVVDRNADSVSYIQNLAALANLKSELNRILCRELKTGFTPLSDIEVRQDLVLDELVKRVDEQNPDLLAARLDMNIARLEKKEAMAAFSPRINLNSGYNFSRMNSEVGTLLSNRNLGYNVGVSATLAIFNGLSNVRQLKVARINEETAGLAAFQKELDLKQQLLQTFNDYQTNITLIGFEKENLSLARRNFFIASERYRLGVISDIDLRETQNKLVEAESRYLQSQYLAKTAETGLMRLAGLLTAEYPLHP